MHAAVPRRLARVAPSRLPAQLAHVRLWSQPRGESSPGATPLQDLLRVTSCRAVQTKSFVLREKQPFLAPGGVNQVERTFCCEIQGAGA